MPDVSIAISAQDGYSAAVKKMADVTKSFDKDAEYMEKLLQRLGTKKFELKMDADKALRELKRLARQFADTGSEADGLKLQLAQANYDNIKRNLALVTKGAGEAERQIQKTGDAFRKADNKAGGGGVAKGLLSGLAASGIAQAAQGMAESVANSFVGSLGGREVGTIFSNVLSTGISGAASGLMVGSSIGSLGGPAGAAIGAAIGAGVGALSGIAQNYQAKDDAFKAYNEGQYSGIQARRADELAGGSATAAKRETDATAFSNSLGGVEPAQAYLTGLRAMDKSTPFTYDDLSGLSKTLLAYGMSKDNIIPTLTAVGDAGAAKGMDSGGIAAIAVALGRMNNTDKANLEYMNLLTERGVDALGWLAERDSSTIADVYDKIRNGEYSGKDVSAFLIQKMSEEFGGMMEMQSKTFAGRSSTLEGWQTDMNSAEGEGYNTPRNEGIARQNAYFEGGMGDALVQMNGIIGAGKAYQENLKEQYGRESMTALLAGGTTTLYDAKQAERLQEMHTEYSSLSARFEAAGENERATIATQIEALKGEAESMAEGAFNASTGMQEIKDVELELIAAIRDNTGALGDAAWNNAYRVAQEQSKGMAASAAHGMRSGTEVIRGGGTIIGGQFYGKDGILLAPGTAAQKKISPYAGTAVSNEQYFSGAGKKAFGMGRVPYDDFPALLHDGERVLTAAQARTADRTGGGLTVRFDGPLTVREEADFGKLARRLAAEIQRAVLLAEPI